MFGRADSIDRETAKAMKMAGATEFSSASSQETLNTAADDRRYCRKARHAVEAAGSAGLEQVRSSSWVIWRN